MGVMTVRRVYENRISLVGSGWTPASLPGLLGWYEADDPLNNNSGGFTTSVNDKSGNGNHLTNSGSVPYSATGYSGTLGTKPAWMFGTDVALIKTSFPIGTGVNASVFVIGQQQTGITAFGGGVVYGNGATNDFSDAGSAAFIVNDSGGASISTFQSGAGKSQAASLDANHRFGCVYGNSLVEIFVDNVSGGTQAELLTAFTNNGTLVIGNRYASAPGGTPWKGPISAVVVANALFNVTHVGNINTYWVGKWGA